MTVKSGLPGLAIVAVATLLASAAPFQAQGPRPTLRMRELTPPAGSVVDSTTVIVAVLDYQVPDSPQYPGPFQVSLAFRSTLGFGFSYATEEENARGPRTLQPRRGRVELRYPLALVWHRADLAKPLRVDFSLGHATGERPAVPLPDSISLGVTFRLIAKMTVEYAVK